MGTIPKLIQVSMTSTNGKECLTTFKAFAEVILAKLDMFEVTNSRAELSFIFDFRHRI